MLEVCFTIGILIGVSLVIAFIRALVRWGKSERPPSGVNLIKLPPALFDPNFKKQ